MGTSRRVAVVAACFTLGVAGAASAVQAAPSNGARPDVVNSAKHAVAGQQVAKDANGRTIVYIDGAQDSVRTAVEKAGGTIANTGQGRVKAAVPQDKLDVVASQPGVTEVRLPDRAVPMAVTSEGVRPSRADEWVAAGKTGAGVKIGIIDVGFGKLAEAQTAGELPPTGSRLTYSSTGCLDAAVKSEHGTNVAEVVHDMAPGAELYLACVEDSMSFAAAADWLHQKGVQIITAAVGFLSPAGSRGDGSGAANSPADVVKRSREAGVLWSVAAGNLARTHFAGTPVDANNNKFVEFRNGVEWNMFTLAGNQSATVSIRWDAWPKTNEDLDLFVMDQEVQPESPGAPAPKAVSRRSQKDANGGLEPTEEVTFTNTAASSRTFYVYVKNNNARFTTPFDLFVAGPSFIQYPTERGSVVEPATSPHVIAVGATEPGSGQIEEYSSRGPTVDGRTKPDITGFDKISTATWPGGGFMGTSAAAAHVAGAAAVLKSANPSLDASQLQTALQSRAVLPANADRTTWGSGVLDLGAPTNVPAAPVGSAFTADSVPERVHSEAYNANEVKTLAFPNLPGGTNAVAITVHAKTDGTNTGDFAIEVGTGDLAAKDGKVPTLYARGDSRNSWQSLTLFAPLDNARSLKLRHRGAGRVSLAVDRLGYFNPSPSVSTNTYFAKTKPERVLDTRGFAGSPRNTPLNATGAEELDVQIRGVAGVPANAKAVVANLTAFEASEEAHLHAHAGNVAQRPGTTSIAVSPGDRRTNLVVVPIRSDGKIRLSSSGNAHAIVGAALDVVGWFAEDTAGARYVPMTDSSRVADTAAGNGLPKAPVGHGQTASFQVAGVAGIDSAATTAAVVLTGQDDLVGTELSAAATEVGWSAASQVGTRRMETAAGLALVPLGKSGKLGVRNERGQTRLTADVTGYFVGGTKVPDSGAAGNCVTSPDGPGFGSAFDGRIESGFGGWRSSGAAMTVDGCELVTADGVDVNWYAAHTYGNEYTMKLDWKATSANSDSGVYVLIKNPGTNAGAPDASAGHEIQIAPAGATDPVLQTGAVVGVKGPQTTTAAKPVGEWNTFEIKVRWNQVTVYLNGVLVNEYGRPDATTVSRETFIGLQNDNVGDPVRFRNIRVKRDSPVRSGEIRAQNDMCVDVLNADATLQKIHMVPCVGNWAQTWTMVDGAIQAGGRCLTIPNGNAHVVAQLLECGGHDLQRWVLRGDGRMITPESGRCLSPVSAAQGSELELRDCATSDSAQVWRVPDQNGRSGQLVGPGAKCLDVANNQPWNHRVGLYPCNATQAQNWTASGDGTLRDGGKCLEVTDGKIANGSAVSIFDCNGSQAQQWVAQSDGTLVNPVSGRCLTSEPQDWAQLTINDCNAGPKQRWRMSATAVAYGSFVGMATKCMDLLNAQPAGPVDLYDCNGTPAQQWSVVGDGTVRIFGHCLDIPAGAENVGVALNSSCRGNIGQVWSVRPDASVVNTWTGMCLDVRNGITDNTTPLQIHRCNGSPAQQWATPVRPS